MALVTSIQLAHGSLRDPHMASLRSTLYLMTWHNAHVRNTKTQALVLSILALIACGIHAAILKSSVHHYSYTSAAKVVLFLTFPVVYFAISKAGRFRDMFAKPDGKGLKLSIILGLVVFTVIWGAFFIVRPYLDPTMIVDALARNGITSGNFAIVFIYVVVINAMLEEIFFRGFVYLGLRLAKLKIYAYCFSSVLFALYHAAILDGAITAGVFVLFMVGLTCAGLIFNALTEKCGSIFGSLFVHICANVAINLIVVVFYL